MSETFYDQGQNDPFEQSRMISQEALSQILTAMVLTFAIFGLTVGTIVYFFVSH